MIGALFSLSFMTVVPLLKVMMGEEGLHSWVDRKVCSWRYGVDFYVPDSSDFTSEKGSNFTHQLMVFGIDDSELMSQAGIKPTDRIVGVAKAKVTEQKQQIPSEIIMKKLADADYGESITLQVRSLEPDGSLSDIKTYTLNTGKIDSFTKTVRKRIGDLGQWAVGYVPRGEGIETRQKAIVLIIILMGGVTTLRCLGRFYQGYLSEKVVQIAIADIREDAFEHSLELPISFLSIHGTSDTISRIINDVNGCGGGIKILLGKALREPMKAIFCLIGAMFISWKLTLVFLLCGPPTIILGTQLGKKIKKYTRRSLRSIAHMLERLGGAINGLRVVKVYNMQEYEHKVYTEVNRKYLKQMLKMSKIKSATGPIMEMLGMIAGSAAMIIGVGWIMRSNMQESSFFALLILMGTAAESIRKSSDVWNRIQNSNAAAERVFEAIDEKPEYDKPGAVECKKLSKYIEFRNVKFSYPKSNTPVLNNFNLKIDAGETVAIVGPNGSGKTTLVNLIPRLYDVDEGAVMIDGTDTRDVTLRSLRSHIGMVTQNIVTFNDTVAANIAYGKPNAAREEIIRAGKLSFADDFIRELPDGYDTFIGEQGAGFSGGQLQRIVIARAILKDPSILIFDEAMSQVDADSEMKIHEAMRELIKNRTCFVIAHRFSTVVSADKIVVLSNGQIAAKGTHSELVKSCGLYQNLYETQLNNPQEQ
jgi:ABC-type multidrug transport system fused ATPase/permease subunit